MLINFCKEENIMLILKRYDDYYSRTRIEWNPKDENEYIYTLPKKLVDLKV